MIVVDRTPDAERTLRNLRAVARHLGKGKDRADAPAAVPRGRSSAWKRWGPVGVVAAFALGKFKLVVPALKFAKAGTLLSMILALWVYAQLWGLPFALGFVLLIFVHEMGHALVMRQQGLRAGAPVFIPFVGAVIAMKDLPRDAYVEAKVALGGPALGTAGAMVCLIVGAASGSLFWYALAFTGFLINLFNMIPISPLDGGRIVGVIGRWLWGVGYVIGVGVFLVTTSPLLFLILLLGLFSLGRTIRGPTPGYFAVPSPARRLIGMAYFGLLIVMALGMWAADGPLQELRASGTGIG
jgi:Zn-dependent protease